MEKEAYTPLPPWYLNGCILADQQLTNHKCSSVYNLKWFKSILVTGTFQNIVPDNIHKQIM